MFCDIRVVVADTVGAALVVNAVVAFHGVLVLVFVNVRVVRCCLRLLMLLLFLWLLMVVTVLLLLLLLGCC